jgi:hypothetical protein
VASLPPGAMRAATPEDREELIRLLAVQAIWPAPSLREEFPTELHLRNAIAKLYDKIYNTVYVPKPYPQGSEKLIPPPNNVCNLCGGRLVTNGLVTVCEDCGQSTRRDGR